MPLSVGSRIAHYDVTALIGEGGMGQVYQATDTKLNRQVALKILPEAFAADLDRLARFQREAQVLASLNHPNIAQIHGLEESGDTRALVLELVEGPTLADRIAQGPIPLDEALPIAKQIAEALEAAHEAGVIHRDLKPANIKVREDGTVKVLDFGLAKALDTSPEGDPSQSPTLTAAATQMGVILGTAAYMSPEQASGKPVDRRTDVWALGVVFYEMLSGIRPFVGDDVSKTLAHVIATDPDWHTLPSNMPPVLGSFLRACLQKDPKRRAQAVGGIRLDMEEVFESAAGVTTAVGPPLRAWQRSASTLVQSAQEGDVDLSLLDAVMPLPIDACLQIRCQRCGALMYLADPGPGQAWLPVQFWVCLECDRHFQTTYPTPRLGYAVVRPDGTRAMHSQSLQKENVDLSSLDEALARPRTQKT